MLRSQARLLVVSIFLALSTLALAQEPEPGYVSLFNGNDLTGWRYGKEILHKQTETPDKRFYVSSGAIVIAPKDKEGKKDVRELTSVREFNRDFILKLEYRASNEAASAVVVRNQAFPANDFIRRGEEKRLSKFQNDGWNTLEIVVKMHAYAEGRRLTESDTLDADWNSGRANAKVNGRSVDPNRVVLQVEAHGRINGESYRNHHVVNSRGTIALRADFGKIEFRNIRFKELP